nr:DpnII family type II restriction endonuclease [Metamycoplasma auris]
MGTRDTKILINDEGRIIEFDFKNINHTFEEYANFLEEIGLFKFLQKMKMSSLIDYVLGIEVGLDSNSRKNRNGKKMEQLVEKYLVDSNFKKEVDFFTQMTTKKLIDIFKIDILNELPIKKFDFVIKYKKQIYAVECNYYKSGGSKVSEIVRSYKNLLDDLRKINNFHFLWITDGFGWIKEKNHLKDALLSIDNIFNLDDLEKKGILNILESIK